MNDVTKQQEILMGHLGFKWLDPKLFLQALTHSSYAHENRQLHLVHNQRLEFLGDAVLELVMSEHLYRTYRNCPEGTLTKMRAGIVCEPSLAEVAVRMNLGQCLLMGRGEERSGGRKRPSILADAVEALIGAIYMDRGLEYVKAFILRELAPVIEKVTAKGGYAGDYKTELQELVQQRTENTLAYDIIDEHGPDHNKTFVAAVNFRGGNWGTGTGRTKKEAEQAAAKDALTRLRAGQLDFPAGEDVD
jgi:ribonuclease-3